MSPLGLDSLIEHKIKQAYAEGHFDDLKHAGRPLDLGHAPHQDPAWRLAFHVLENAGLAPAWVEERRSIQRAINRLPPAKSDPSSAQLTADGTRPEFILEIQALNKRIESFNLGIPHPGFRLQPVRV